MKYRYSTLDLRKDENEPDNKISGYFSVFNSEYRMFDGVSEKIDVNAFDESLANDDGSIRCLWNHDDSIVLGRTGSGTLRLHVDEHGLFGEVDVNPDDSDAMNALARIKRGDVDQCSIGFEILAEDFEERDENDVLFTIRKVKLWEVSPVTFPAYKETSISARKADLQEIKKNELRLWRAQQRSKLDGIKKTIS